jgi:hypothetical protein
VIQISALITRDNTKAILEDTFESELKPEDLPIFYPVFAEWGLIGESVIKMDTDSSAAASKTAYTKKTFGKQRNGKPH